VVYEVFFELVFGSNVCLQLRILLKGMTDSDKTMAKEQRIRSSSSLVFIVGEEVQECRTFLEWSALICLGEWVVGCWALCMIVEVREHVIVDYRP
jgi:hypothetical protein